MKVSLSKGYVQVFNLGWYFVRFVQGVNSGFCFRVVHTTQRPVLSYLGFHQGAQGIGKTRQPGGEGIWLASLHPLDPDP